MANLGSVSVSVDANIAGFESDMGRAARVAEREFKKMERDAARAREQITVSVVAIGTAIGNYLGEAIKGIARSIPAVIDRMDDLSKAAQKVGLPTEDFSRLTYAAGLADVSMDTLVGSLGKLTKSQAAALKSTSEQAKVFGALGIAVQDSSGKLRESDDVLADFADKFKEFGGSPEIIAAGFALFGRSFQDLIPLLKDGAAGLRNAGAEADALGATLSTKAGQDAEAFNDNLTRLKSAAQGLALSIASDLLPQMVELTNGLVESASQMGGTSEVSDTLGVALDGLVTFATTLYGTLDSLSSAVGGASSAISGMGISSDETSEKLRKLLASVNGLASIGEGITSAGAAVVAKLRGDADEYEKQVARFNRSNNVFAAGWSGRDIKNDAKFKGPPIIAIPSLMGQPFNATSPQFPYAPTDSRRQSKQEDQLRKIFAGGDTRAKSGHAARAAKAGKSDAEREAEALQKSYGSLIATQLERIALFGKEDDASKITYDTQFGSLMKLSQVEKDRLIDNAKKIDTLREETEAKKAQADVEKRLVEAKDENIKRAAQQISDMQFELALIGMSNAEREREIALRQAGDDATDAQRQQIVGLTDAMRAASEQAKFIDDIKSGLSDMFVDFVSGAKTAKEAFGDFADQLFKRALQFVADKAIQALFDSFSNKGSGAASGGSSGSGWGGIISGIIGAFGGGRAGGGPVMGGNFYEVGEQNRPEMFRSRGKSYLIPGNDGAVMPMRSGGGVQQVNNFNYSAPYDARTESQKNARLAFETRRATARN